MRKVMKNAIITFLILFLGISTVFLAYLHFFASDDRNLTGEWCAELDMTGQAAAMAYSWLRDIESVSVSLDEVESYMQDLTIQVNLTMEQTGRAEVRWEPSAAVFCRRVMMPAGRRLMKHLPRRFDPLWRRDCVWQVMGTMRRGKPWKLW